MTTPDPNAAGNAAEPTVQSQTQPGSQPDYKSLWEKAVREAEEYKSRHAGLQGKYQQEQQKWQTDAQRLGEFERQLQALTGEREALALQLNALNTEKATLSTELTQTKGKVERVNLIAKEFTHLLPFEADGLLPDGMGDDLKAKLTAFSQKLQGMSKEAIADFQKGGTPPPPAEPANNTSAAMFKLASQAQREGKLDEYDRLYDQALKLKAQGK